MWKIRLPSPHSHGLVGPQGTEIQFHIQPNLERHRASSIVDEGLQKDSLLAPLRDMAEWPPLLATAQQGQDKFLAERNPPQH